VRWMESILSERTVEIINEVNAIESPTVVAGVPQGSPASPILFAIYTSELIQWVEEYVSVAKGQCYVDDLSWGGTGRDVNYVVSIPERCAAPSIEWASRQGLQLDTAKTEAAQCTWRRGHRKHLRPKRTAMM